MAAGNVVANSSLSRSDCNVYVAVDTVCDVNPEHQLTKSQKEVLASQVEGELQEACQVFRALSKERLDLLEVCAPWDSPLAQAVEDAGGRVFRMGPHNGFDLSTRSGFLAAARFIREHRPCHLHFSPPCFPWSPLRNLTKGLPGRQELLHADRRFGKRILQNCRRLMEIQAQELQEQSSGHAPGHASGEQPLHL